ncbi:hypothetical protein [Nocardiopsis sp. CNS-639]|uniref:hypothetical protein n=1 Tax=Nocardiopsis sp. CNS-639 TaxID=1169153 RepID=UPI00037A35AE|nr:hypothetical protein [Nocardiopsis sp. CNS-639]
MGRPSTKGTESSAGERPIGLPGPLVALLREHRASQEQERDAAGDLWEEGGSGSGTAN